MSLAFVFPGQGSQSVGMLSALAGQYAEVKDTFATASDALGYDLWRLVQEGPEEELNQTHVTQPALLAAGVAVWRVWQARGGPSPVLLAGHSLGEYTALVCAGALALADGIRLVEARGRFMQQAVIAGEGAMAAILGLDDERVITLCRSVADNDVVVAANFNAPGQVVISGHRGAVDKVVAQAKDAGAKRAVTLAVSVPSHCPLMEPASRQLSEMLTGIEMHQPHIGVVQNADARAYDDIENIRDALVRQLVSPVKWVDCINTMTGAGVTTLVECGPGKVLTGLNKRIAPRAVSLPVHDAATLDEALQQTKGAE